MALHQKQIFFLYFRTFDLLIAMGMLNFQKYCLTKTSTNRDLGAGVSKTYVCVVRTPQSLIL